MHYVTRVPPEYEGKSGLSNYADGMLQHDDQVGQLLDKLDELQLTENTNWEGGYRVPALVRWPGKIAPNTFTNQIMASNDWLPTILAAVGEPDIKKKLLDGYRAGDEKYRVHLDGYNMLPWLIGAAEEKDWPRHEFFYWNDDGQLVAMRYNRWKLVFME